MAATLVNEKKTVSEIFNSMSYGPAPEDQKAAEKWFNSQNRAFGHFINGEWVKPEGRHTYENKCPATGEVLATTIHGESDDIDLAVNAASEAYKSWSSLTPDTRARHLYSIARNVQKHQRLLSVVEALDNGKSIRETRDCDVPLVVRHFYHHSGWANLAEEEMKDRTSIGVVAAIVPWNFPLMLLTWKIAPALAMGNTVVLKPASYTRLSALLLAEICAEAGLPPGVFNVVTGPGSFGSTLAMHRLVDKVAFTGSTAVGQSLRRATAGSGKKLSLELGGKSPVVVFESADLDSAVEGIVDAIWFNQGQVCSAGSRLLVQEPVETKLVEKLKERLQKLRLGHCLDKAIDMGAIVDESQRKDIDRYVQQAREEGADVFQLADFPSTGIYYPPTLITKVQTSSTVVTDEIFGPVLVVLPFRTAKEAINLANNTIYGLGASVWTEHISLGLEVANQIKAGSVWVNSHNLFDAAAGFGGFKQSGFGRDGGREGLFEYTKPVSETRVRPQIDGDVKDFGKADMGIPQLSKNKHDANDVKIDRTYKLYYAGAQKRPDGNYSRPVYGYHTSVLAYVADSNRKDVRNAVEAAAKAAPGWGKRAAHNRAQIIYYIAENLELRRPEFARSLENMTGRGMDDCLLEVDIAIRRLFYWAAYADKYGGTVQETNLYGVTAKIHDPVGVIGVACPDDDPLLSFVSLLAPAIVRGNVVVIVPSEKHPLAALELYQVFETSDVPAGVVNILTGSRDHISKFLTEHQNVQAMWYHAPSAMGSKFVEYMSAENIKRTWVNYGEKRDWRDRVAGQSEDFLYHSIQAKNIWIPMGDIFAN